jgi:hypothetical protein
MPNVTISINSRRPLGRNWSGKRGITILRDLLSAINSGAVQSDAVTYGSNDATALGNDAYAGHACAALVGSTLTGAVGAVIDGTTVTVTAASGDVATQTALCTAIAANTSVNKKVSAANRVAQMTLASVAAGTMVRVFGITFTAISGTPTEFGQFDMSGTDTADATSLALAINRHPALAGRCRAVSSAGVVYVGLLEQRTAGPTESITLPSASTITVNTSIPVASAVTLLFAQVPGAIGECCTVVASGTGMTVATANSGKLGGGTGGATSMTFVVP